MDGYQDHSTTSPSIVERARTVKYRGESPNEKWFGEVEVMSSQGNTVSLHIQRAHLKKFGGKKWHTESVYVTLTAEAWAHLCSAPIA